MMHNGARLFGGERTTLAKKIVHFLTLNHQDAWNTIARKERDVVAVERLTAVWENM